MSEVCPKCGSENVTPFSDSVYKTHGFECENCHHDFGVDDGKMLDEKISSLISIYYERKGKDGVSKRIEIKEENKKVTVTPSILYPNKYLQPITPQELPVDVFTQFKSILVKNIFILDWNEENNGLLTLPDETFKVILTFNNNETKTIKGVNKFPPYLVVLDQIVSSFYEVEE